MLESTLIDLPGYYSRYFDRGAVDLSASSPTPRRPDVAARFALAPEEWSHSTPSGSRGLREAIARRYTTIGADEIVVCSGASEALAALAYATLGRDAVAWSEPGIYASFTVAAQHCGATVTGFGDTEHAAVAIANNPGVPGGDIRDIGRFISRSIAAGAVPVVDEVYRDLVLEGTAIPAACDLDRRAVSIGDISKPLGLGGLRIGWIATHDAALLRRLDRELQLLSGGPSILSVAAAECAMQAYDESVAATISRARTNGPEIISTLRDAGWTAHLPQAGLTTLACPPRPYPGTALSRLRRAEFFLLPTSVFGLPGGFRVSLLIEPRVLRDALRVLESGTPANHLVILAKAPAAGQAKSRLAKSLGAEATRSLASAFFEDTVSLAEKVTESDLTIALEPFTCAEASHDGLPRPRFVPQADGDLGERIIGALSAGAPGMPAVLIGSDTPDLPPCVVEEAFRLLQTHDTVIGPARDGGFYLLGWRAPIAGIFEGVEWSTDSVLSRTLANISAAGHTCAVLQEWEDVDDAQSLEKLSIRLQTSDAAPATRAALAAIALEAPGVR